MSLVDAWSFRREKQTASTFTERLLYVCALLSKQRVAPPGLESPTFLIMGAQSTTEMGGFLLGTFSPTEDTGQH